MHDANLLEDQPIAWIPTPEVIERAQLTKFMRQVGVSTWDELYEFSIRDVEKFTEEVIKFLDIKFDPPYEKLLDTSNGIEFPNWFLRSGDTPVPTDAAAASEERSAASGSGDKSVAAPSGLNITEMCLDRWQTDKMKDQLAVIWEGQTNDSDPQPLLGATRFLTFSELLRDVEYCSAALRSHGIRVGDAVGIHLSMVPETVIALLALSRIGAIAVPVFSGYGIDAIVSRLNAIEAKALFTCDGFPRRNSFFYAGDVAQAAVPQVPSIQKVFVVQRYYGAEASVMDTNNGVWFDFDFMLKQGANEFAGLRSVEPTSAEDPLIILYTSGTTGKPKGIAHTHASFPIKAAQDMAFGTDVGRGTRICWYTDIGWMMGPWLIYGALINGATICIYDGAPDYPTPDRMWEFCAKHKVEILGISPTLVRALAAHERSGDTLVPTDAASASEKLSAASGSGDKSVAAPRRGWSRKGKLPHYDGDVTQFITFRLHDSLPRPVLERLKLQLEHDKLSDDSEEYRQRIEDYLDEGAGECLLGDPKIAAIVEETLLREHGMSCEIKAWVVMPNHAHVLLRLNPGHDLAGLMKRVKGISARKINIALDRAGSVWQKDYFDRYIRSEKHYQRVLTYIENNPVASRLATAAEAWPFSSAYGRRVDTSVFTDESDSAASGSGDRSVAAPHARHDLSSLRMFASTGEPWNPAPWWWLFEKVGNSKLPIINYSGGTEIAGGILMGNPLLPQKPCSFPAPCPGMDVDIFNEKGESVKPGEVGELVIKQPWIGMARGFWQEKERYLDTYWRRFKDIWVHGDFAMRDEDGHWFILGRSDDTLKVAGKRVGPAEVESLLVAHPLVTEAAVIGVPDEKKGTAMVAFVVLSDFSTLRRKDAKSSDKGSPPYEGGMDATSADGVVLSDSNLVTHHSSLQQELKTLVAKDMGKPLAPSKIHFVSALPKTRNAKVMRRVIRSAYLGEDPGDLSALENPAAVDEIQSQKV